MLHAQRCPGAKLQCGPVTASSRWCGEVRISIRLSFAHTFRFTHYDDLVHLDYELKPVAGRIEVMLTVDNVTAETRTAKDMARGSTTILNTLKSVIETGRPELRTRIMYWLMDRMTFVLPKRCRTEAWPL